VSYVVKGFRLMKCYLFLTLQYHLEILKYVQYYLELLYTIQVV